jgi:hypothetical protein
VLLFLVLRQMTGSLWRSAFVAALFAVHPLRAESVAWVSERKDVLSGFFFMLAIGAYVRYAEKWKAESRKQKFFYALTLVFFALGLLAKSMVATLPFVLLLLDYWPLGRFHNLRSSSAWRGKRFRSLCPCRGIVRGDGAGARTDGHGCPTASAHLERLGNALVSYVVYLRQMVFPAGLAMPLSFTRPTASRLEGLPGVCPAGGDLRGVMVCRKKRPVPAGGLALVSGDVVSGHRDHSNIPDAAHADRYTYLPGIGLAMAATWAVADWSAGWKYRRLILGGLMDGGDWRD